jgi:hypothetical protein
MCILTAEAACMEDTVIVRKIAMVITAWVGLWYHVLLLAEFCISDNFLDENKPLRETIEKVRKIPNAPEYDLGRGTILDLFNTIKCFINDFIYSMSNHIKHDLERLAVEVIGLGRRPEAGNDIVEDEVQQEFDLERLAFEVIGLERRPEAGNDIVEDEIQQEFEIEVLVPTWWYYPFWVHQQYIIKMLYRYGTVSHYKLPYLFLIIVGPYYYKMNKYIIQDCLHSRLQTYSCYI